MKKLLIAIIVLGSFSSCSNYYKAVLVPQPANADSIGNLKKTNRYFILRNGSEAFVMTNISISTDNKNLQCNLETLPFEHRLHLTNGRNGKMKYNKKNNITDENETAVLNEVHIYLTPDGNIAPGPYTLALDKVKKTEIIEKDKIKTKHSYAMGTAVGISTAVVGIGVIVALMAASGVSPIHF